MRVGLPAPLRGRSSGCRADLRCIARAVAKQRVVVVDMSLCICDCGDRLRRARRPAQMFGRAREIFICSTPTE